MKKRLLSVMLLLAMLITAVPVIVSAEETFAESATVDTAGDSVDLHDYYVKDGLTALYSTFGADNGVNLTDGTWTSKVGTGVATLGVKARWSVGEHGGIGYTVLYGTVAADGSYTKESSYNNHNNSNLYLGFGISQLNNGDFTVEYMAMQKPLYVADAECKILVKDGKKVESYDAFGEKGLPGGLAASNGLPVDMLGWVSSWSNRVDDAYWTGGRGELYWIYDNNTWYAGRNGHRLNAFTKNDPLKNNNVVGTYALLMDESVTVTPATEEGAEDVTVTSAYFQLYRNATRYSAISFSTKNIGTNEAIIWHDAGTAFKSGANFLLSRATPIDFFSVRIYNRALTTEDMLHNHVVDLLLYYGVAVERSVIENADVWEILLAKAAKLPFETASDAKMATKKQLEDMIKGACEQVALLGRYAAPENLTSLFSIYITGTLDVAKGTWEDVVAGGSATMQTPSRWFVNADGSFGYNAFVGYVNGDTSAMNTTVNNDRTSIEALGNVPTANHAYWKNNALTFGLSKLPAEDYTIEYMAMYRPYLVADAAKSTKDQIVYAKDAEGNLIEAYNLFGTTPATTDYGSPGARPVDTIGHFTTLTQRVDSTSGWGSSVRGTQHYMYKCHYWGTASQRNWLGSGTFSATAGLALKGDPFKKNDEIIVYSITLDETKDESGALSANFGLYRDAKLYNENKGVITWHADAPDKTYTGELLSSAEFYLSSHQPTDFYGVRIYDKVLTTQERLQNRAIDLLLYYGIDYPTELFTKQDGYTAEMFYNEIVGYSFATNAVEKAAVADAIRGFIALRMDSARMLYVQNELTALFTAFEGETDALVTTSGTNKIWHNRVIGGADATFTGSIWTVSKNGGVSKVYWRGTATDGVVSVGSESWNTPMTATPLQLGLDLLPDDDYTVEYLAYFPPMYAKDSKTGEAVAHYLGFSTESAPYYRVDMYGFLEFNTVKPGGTFDGMNNYLRGRVGDAGLKSWGGSTGGGTYGFGAVNFKVDKRDTLKVDTYGVYRDETTVMDGDTVVEVKANYGTLYNTEVTHKLTNFTTAYVSGGMQGVYASSTEMKDGKYYFGDDTGRDFYLSNTAGATFYALRIYSRVLTQDEREQNRMADILYYYGIQLSDAQMADGTLLAYLRAVTKTISLAQDASAKAAGKAALLSKIEECYATDRMDDIYVTDGLTAHYTTFRPGQYDIVNGTWTDRVSYATASLVNKGAYWRAGEHGGVGYNGFYGAFDAETGEYNGAVSSNTQYDNTRLDFGIAQLPDDDFTIDYLAMYKPMYVYDANEADHIARDASGNKIETFSKNPNTTGLYLDQGSIDNLGWFQSVTGGLDGDTYEGWRSDAYTAEEARGATHWVFGQQNGNSSGWYTSAQSFFMGTKSLTGGLNKVGNSYQTNNVIRSYTITVDENTTGAGDEAVTTALFSLYRDAEFYNSNKAVGDLNTSSKGFADGGYYVAGTPYDSKCRFWLSQNRPVDFFAVRIYEKVLSENEKLQNRGADLVLYYGIAITEALAANPEVLATAQKGIAFATNAAEKAANKEAMIAALADLKTDVTVKIGSVETVLELYSDTLTLPNTFDGKMAIAWRVNGAAEAVAPGTSIDVAGVETLTPTLFALPKTSAKTSVRVTDIEADLGVRFTASVDRVDYEGLIALFGENYVRLGMLITPDAYVQKAGGVFTREALRAMVDASKSTSGAAYIDIRAYNFYSIDDTKMTLAGTVYSFKNRTMTLNPAFAAIAYLDVDTNRDGVVDITIYGSYNPVASTTVTSAMNRAVENMTATQKGWIDSLLSRFGA